MAKTYILEPTKVQLIEDTDPIPSENDQVYPVNNFDFSDHPRNDMAGIDDLLDDILGLKESEDEESTPDSGGGDDEGGIR